MSGFGQLRERQSSAINAIGREFPSPGANKHHHAGGRRRPVRTRVGHRGAKRNAASEAFRRLFRVLALIIVTATLGIVRVANSRKRRVGTRCR